MDLAEQSCGDHRSEQSDPWVACGNGGTEGGHRTDEHHAFHTKVQDT